MLDIALFGASGYIGQILHQALSKEHRIHCMTDIDSTLFPLCDVILYFIGKYKKTDDPDEMYSVNVKKFKTMMDQVQPHQMVIYASTGSIYTKQSTTSECGTLDVTIMNPYESSMYARERIAVGRTVGLRLGTVTGVSPRLRRDSVYNGIYAAVLRGIPINVWNPNSSRTILWKDDLIMAIRTIIENRDRITGPTILNMGSFNSTIQQIAEYAANATQTPIELHGSDTNTGFTMELSKFSLLFNCTMTGNMSQIHDHYMRNHTDFLSLLTNVQCLICDGRNMISILDLGNQPLANEFTKTRCSIEKYPLHLYRCLHCRHTQLDYFVDEEKLFRNYIYESGVSNTILKYFAKFADHYAAYGNTILEIACNDGSQLDEFKRRGWKTHGVDPAANIVNQCSIKGHDIDIKFWGKEPTKFDNQTFDLIIAQNVFAHTTTPIAFLQACKRVMNRESLLVIQTSQSEMYFNGEFDTIYHEHVSFFTIQSMFCAAKRVGLCLRNVRKEPIHGVSYVFELVIPSDIAMDDTLLKEEESRGLYNDAIYTRYTNSIIHIKERVLSVVQSYATKGYTILGYGAAAKGNVFLNYVFDSNPHTLCPELIVDDSVRKQGTYTPGTQILVTKMDALNNYTGKKLVVLILAWNFADEILRKVRSICPDAICIQFFPNFIEHRQ